MADALWKNSDEIFINSDDIWFDFYLSDPLNDFTSVTDDLAFVLFLLPNVNDSVSISESLQGLLPELFISLDDSVSLVENINFDLFFLIIVFLISEIHTVVLHDSLLLGNRVSILPSDIHTTVLENSWMN